MRKLVLLPLLLSLLVTQTGCAASDTNPPPVPDAGAGPANGYTPLVATSDEGKIDQEVVRELQENHYSKVDLDNAFSEKFFDAYIDDLDGTHSVFLASDIDRLRKRYGNTLDDELKNGQTTGAFDIFNTYQKRRIQIDQWALGRLGNGQASRNSGQADSQAASQTSGQPVSTANGIDTLDLHNNESFNVDREKAPWPADAAAREALWTKQLENQVIDLRLSDTKPVDIQKRLTDRYRNELKQLRQAEPTDAFSAYMDAYTHSYDPHTDYFSPRRYEDFNIDMNLQLQGIGAELQSKSGYAELVRLIPGGPAAKSGKLKPTDRIIAVGQGDSGDFTDVIGMRLDETVQLIRGKAGSTVRLQVSPADNSATRTVVLKRAKIKLKDQAASSKIIHLKRDGQNASVGVITLPSFYNGTSDDVKKLLVKLKKQDVDGVILDLRNDGGGALGEAMQLIGLFMDSAPGVQIKDAKGHIQVLGDRNRGAVYDGPLAVLTNRLSASASEIVAGALQDYGRAVILGSQTYGKGTVQTLLPLSSGQLKLTEAKFYRVTGNSTQDRGVTPDVIFPSAIDPKKIGESTSPNALPWDEIQPTSYPYSNEIQQLLGTLRTEHRQRVATDADYQYLIKRIALARKESAEDTVSLNLDTRKAEQTELEHKTLELANNHNKATGKPPYKDYKALEDAQDKQDAAGDGADATDDTLPTADPSARSHDFDAYQTEAAQIVLDMIQAFVAQQNQGKAA